MNAIISNGDYTASVQLPVNRKQLAGALSYLGANHASEYDIKYNEESDKGLSFTLDCRGIVENAIAKAILTGFRFHTFNDTITLMHNLPYQSRREFENTVKVEGLASYEQLKDMQNFGFLGYKTGENKYTYPKFGRAKAEDLLTELCRLADYVIVDCTSNLSDNVIAQTAIEKADQILRLSSPDLQSISFFLSQLPVYGDSKFRLDDHIVGLNTPNVDVFMPIEEAKTQLGEVSFTVPFSAQVKEQMQQGKIHVKTTDKRFEARMQDIASKVVAYGTD